MKTNKSPALSCCIRQIPPNSSMLCLGPLNAQQCVTDLENLVAGRDLKGSSKMPPFVGPAAEEALCCTLSLIPLVSNLRQYLNIHYSEFHFSALFFLNLKKERKTRLATVSYISAGKK